MNFATILDHQVDADRRETVGGVRIDEEYEDERRCQRLTNPAILCRTKMIVYPSNVDSMIEDGRNHKLQELSRQILRL